MLSDDREAVTLTAGEWYWLARAYPPPAIARRIAEVVSRPSARLVSVELSTASARWVRAHLQDTGADDDR